MGRKSRHFVTEPVILIFLSYTHFCAAGVCVGRPSCPGDVIWAWAAVIEYWS